jgi:ABC-type transport system substrate-binding protein
MTRRAVAPVVLLLTLAACQEASQAVAPAPNEPETPSLELVAVYQHPTVAAIQYNLSSNGTFELRYGNRVSYGGSYNNSETLISFDFSNGVAHSWCDEAWCKSWLAMGRLRGDTLLVEYDRATSWLLCNDMDSEICNKRAARYIRVAK